MYYSSQLSISCTAIHIFSFIFVYIVLLIVLHTKLDGNFPEALIRTRTRDYWLKVATKQGDFKDSESKFLNDLVLGQPNVELSPHRSTVFCDENSWAGACKSR